MQKQCPTGLHFKKCWQTKKPIPAFECLIEDARLVISKISHLWTSKLLSSKEHRNDSFLPEHNMHGNGLGCFCILFSIWYRDKACKKWGGDVCTARRHLGHGHICFRRTLLSVFWNLIDEFFALSTYKCFFIPFSLLQTSIANISSHDAIIISPLRSAAWYPKKFRSFACSSHDYAVASVREH